MKDKKTFKSITEKLFYSLKKDLGLKLLSVLVGFIMWALVIGDLNPVVSRTFEDVPIKISNQLALEKNKLILVESNINTVSVEVSGTRNDILALNKNDIVVEAKLSDSFNSGTHRLDLNVSTPINNIKATTTEKYVSVILDHEISKDFDVSVEIVGGVKNQNQVVTKKEPSEKTVNISGATSVLNRIKKVVATVDISAMDKSEVVSSKIVAYDEFDTPIKNIKLKKDDTNVTIAFQHFKEVPIELSTVNVIDKDIKLLKSEIVPKVISIVGSQESLEKVSKVLTKPLDLSQIKETGVYPIVLDLPKDISLVDTITKFVVNIDVDKIVEKVIKIPKNKVEIINETNKSYTNDIPNTVEVTVRGYESIISTLNSGNVKLYVKISEDSEKISAKFQMKAIEGVELVSTNPEVANFVEKKD